MQLLTVVFFGLSFEGLYWQSARSRPATRHDTDFVHQIGVFAVGADQRVPHLVVCDALPLLLVEPPALAFRASDAFFDSLFDVLVGNGFGLSARGQKSRLVQRVGQIGAGKTGRRLGDRTELDIVGQRFVAGVNLQDRFAADQVGRVDDHLTIKAARPQQGSVQHFRPVGGGQEDDASVRLEAVHFDQQLVQRLLALVINRADVDAPFAPDGVQFVGKYPDSICRPQPMTTWHWAGAVPSWVISRYDSCSSASHRHLF